MPQDYGELMAEAASGGYDSPAEMDTAKRRAKQAAAEIEADYSEDLASGEE